MYWHMSCSLPVMFGSCRVRNVVAGFRLMLCRGHGFVSLVLCLCLLVSWFDGFYACFLLNSQLHWSINLVFFLS